MSKVVPATERNSEKHYSVAEVAELWGFSVLTIRRLFADTPGVLRIGTGSHKTLSIPASVLRKEHERLTSD
jgi:hypothetical protein